MTMNTQANLATNQQKGRVLCVDYLDFLWDNYETAMPENTDLVLVRDTTSAMTILEHYSDISVIVVQLNSFRRYTPNPLSISPFGPDNTREFVRWVLKRNYNVKLFVVSSMMSPNEAAAVEPIAPDVTHMNKAEFWAKTPSLLADVHMRPAMQVLEELFANLTSSEESEAAASMIEGLEKFQGLLSGDVFMAYCWLASMDIFDSYSQICCESAEPRDAGSKWVHTHHGLYNKATREAIDAVPGMREQLLQRLEADFAAPDDYIDQMGPFGEYLLKSTANQLQSLLAEKVDVRQWFAPWQRA
jgi:hypothetical protein